MEIQSDPEAIAASQRILVIQLTSDNNKMDLSPRYFREVNSKCLQELVTGVLQVVLIHRVVDDPLHITFVVTNLKIDFEAVLHHVL